MVACTAEGHSYSVPQLKLVAIARILEPIQEAAAGCKTQLTNLVAISFKLFRDLQMQEIKNVSSKR